MSKTLRTNDYSGIAAAILADRPFKTGGALRGDVTAHGAGRLSMAPDLDRWRAECYDVTYVVYSYATPIAWRNAEGEWYVVTEKFSQTTAQHRSTVLAALRHGDLLGA